MLKRSAKKMEIYSVYEFTATTAGFDTEDENTTLYVADKAGGPYFLMQRSLTEKPPQPEDLYLEFGGQNSGAYGSLKRLALTRQSLEAFIEDGTKVSIDLSVGDEEWTNLEEGLKILLKGLEPFILRN